MKTEEIKKIVQDALTNQFYGILNTIRNEHPHSTLVGFAPTPDLTKIIIATSKSTRKIVNSQLYKNVSFFVETTKNLPTDIENALTISINGTTEVGNKLELNKFDEYKEIYLKKNKHMEFFFTPNVDLVIISVETYDISLSYKESYSLDKNFNSIDTRQTSGEAITKGSNRGKTVKFSNLQSLKDMNQKPNILVESLPTEENLKKGDFGGLIIKEKEISGSLKKYFTENNIPVVVLDKESFDTITEGEDVTIDGYFGVVVFHKIKI